MKLKEIITLINGTLLAGNDQLRDEITGGCGADLMSDVLASAQPNAVLLTGLCNPQIVRTAQMADIRAIILVRGKQAPKETIELASEEGIPLVSSPYGMFELCGRLYEAGLKGMERTMTHNCFGE